MIVEMDPARDVTLEVCAFDKLAATEPVHTFEDPRPAIIICPGGGYEFLSEREADPVAIAFQRFGFNTFVLRYSIREHSAFPQPVVDAARAVRWVRRHADELRVDPHRVAVLGFSAGGHVTAMLGTLHDHPDVLAAERDEYPRLAAAGVAANEGLLDHPSRPDAIVPCYAVFHDDWSGADGYRRIMGTNCLAAVGAHVPPSFVWTTGEDATVPPTQSLRFVTALSEHGVPFEYHHFAHGAHGLSLADRLVNHLADVPENAHSWVELCARWLRATLG